MTSRIKHLHLADLKKRIQDEARNPEAFAYRFGHSAGKLMCRQINMREAFLPPVVIRPFVC